MSLDFTRLLRKKPVYLFMALWAAVLGCAPANAPAMPVESGIASAACSQRQADLTSISRFLEQEAVRQKLAEMGLEESEIRYCLSRLDDSQLRQLTLRVEGIKAGAGASWFLVVIFLGLVFIAVLYFTEYHIVLEPKSKTEKR